MIRISGVIAESDLSICVAYLRQGEIISYPTETFYALGIDPENAAAVDRLYELKGRPSEKQFPLIACDVQMVQECCDTKLEAFDKLANAFWPGPLTLVLRSRKQGGTMAIRVSSHPVARQLSCALGKPIVSTSANQSGRASIQDPNVVSAIFAKEIAALIDAGNSPGGLPSTIVSLVDSMPRILREGALPAQVIFDTL